jgi:hypothetical protein
MKISRSDIYAPLSQLSLLAIKITAEEEPASALHPQSHPGVAGIHDYRVKEQEMRDSVNQ